MRNILSGLVFMSAVLPQVSFGATTPVVTPPVNPQVTACNQKMDAEANAFFQGQGAERGAWLKTNANLVAAHDLRFKEMLAIRNAQRLGQSTAGLPVPPAEDPAFTDFIAKQQGDKAAFLGKLAQDRQNCLAGAGVTTTDTTTTGT